MVINMNKIQEPTMEDKKREMDRTNVDPMGDGDTCTCGGKIMWKMEGSEGQPAHKMGRCQSCGMIYG